MWALSLDILRVCDYFSSALVHSSHQCHEAKQALWFRINSLNLLLLSVCALTYSYMPMGKCPILQTFSF